MELGVLWPIKEFTRQNKLFLQGTGENKLITRQERQKELTDANKKIVISCSPLLYMLAITLAIYDMATCYSHQPAIL